MTFYQLLFSKNINGVNRNLTWYWNLFVRYMRENVWKLLAKILKIKGNTIVWNQLVENGNFADTSGWNVSGTPNGASVSVLNNEVTFQFGTTSISSLYRPISYVSGHKYYYAVSIKGDATYTNLISATLGSSYYIMTYDSITTSYKRFEKVLTINSTYSNFNVVRNNSSNGEKVYVKDCILVDLTKLGLDSITDPSEFTSLYPLNYYAHGSGSLLSFNGTGIKTVGKNLCGGTPTQISGTTIDLVTNTLISGTYTFSCSCPFNINGIYVRKGSTNSDPLIATVYDKKAVTFTLDSTSQVFIRFYHGAGITVSDLTDIQIEFGSTATPYVPYTSSTLSLPISTYFPTGMKDVGNGVYDELDLVNQKAIHRVGEVDLGSLSWYTEGTNTSGIVRMASQGIKDLVKKPSAGNVTANIKCAIYDIKTADQTYLKYNGISINTGGVICIYDENYNTSSSVSAFKTAMNGVYLYYELATPTEVSIDPPLNLSYEIEWGGTEQLLPENTSTPTTSPISATVEYPDGEHEDYYTYQEIEKNHLRLNRALSIMLGKNVIIENPQEPLDIIMRGE